MQTPENSQQLAVDDKAIAAALGMSVAWVRKDRTTNRTVPFFRLGTSVRYNLATVQKAMLSRMEGIASEATRRAQKS